MKTCSGSVLIVLLAFGFVGAAQESPYESALKQALQGLDKIGVSLEAIKDEDSAAAVKPDLRKSAASFVDARAKAEKLQPPEKEEKRRLEKLYKPKLKDAMEKMFVQVGRVELIPGGKDALKEISSVLKKNGK